MRMGEWFVHVSFCDKIKNLKLKKQYIPKVKMFQLLKTADLSRQLFNLIVKHI